MGTTALAQFVLVIEASGEITSDYLNKLTATTHKVCMTVIAAG